MNNFMPNKISTILLYSVIVITVTDILGSIASRKLGFNYSYLVVISVLLYGFLAHLMWQKVGKWPALFFLCLLGIFDGTVGLYISIKLEANTGSQVIPLTLPYYIASAIVMILFCSLVGLLAIWISKRLLTNSSTNL